MSEVLRVLEGYASDPEVARQFDERLRQILDEASGTNAVDGMRRRKVAVEKQLAAAERRILIVDDELLPIIQRQVKELLAEQKQLTADLAVAETPVESVIETNQKQFQAARDSMHKVRRMLANNAPCEVRALLTQLIDRVEVKVERRQSKGMKLFYYIAGGEIRLHESLLTLVNRR